ncbi:murein L,D-transpeptidase catalytic domain-containing protein [Flammeovirga sp. SubArs3]|uniref:murein L,D-transpeptidase catalytic domain-containing protein n=1 Tax=Flammeovirga sp. SubArs3 TaxID=2995316 RepID=UPI00248CEAD0|nr:murein L,D-transpeptidase catalytic domain family protein [Flammeovirga sp. SubArs3]
MKAIYSLLIFILFTFQLFAQEDTTSHWLEEWNKERYQNDQKKFTQEKIKNRIEQKAKEALIYNQKNNLSSKYCILIDMGIHSGRNRFFVYDLEKKTVLKEALVSHGCGDFMWSSDETRAKPTFSNVFESHLSSLGKYKIGKRGYSNWGIHVNYKMHGLESSNSNAYKRIIVLHSWEAVKDEEIFPEGTAEGWGCPAVSNTTMRYLDPLLKSEDDVLMWIYQ